MPPQNPNNTSENQLQLGPPQISFATFLLKIIAGSFGGVLGSLIFLSIFVLASSILDPLTEGTGIEEVSPIFTFILLIMVFLATGIGNTVSCWLLALTERDKYHRIASSIYQIFIFSLIVFLLMVPVYFLSAGSGVMPYAVALHIFLTAQVSAIILELVSNPRHALVGLYGIAFSILVSASAIFLIAGQIENLYLLLFVVLPVIWASIAVVQSLFTMIYGWIARTYDEDFLSTRTKYGEDYGKKIEKAPTPKAKDEAGADFLRHN